jgi:hypothetical protein
MAQERNFRALRCSGWRWVSDETNVVFFINFKVLMFEAPAARFVTEL